MLNLYALFALKFLLPQWIYAFIKFIGTVQFIGRFIYSMQIMDAIENMGLMPIDRFSTRHLHKRQCKKLIAKDMLCLLLPYCLQ